jgi:transposase
MSRPRCIDPKLVTKAQILVTKTTDLNEFRAAQSILLPALAHTTLEQTASLLGVGRATVARLQQRLRETTQAVVPLRRQWGGRRRALLSFEEEKEFLAPWVEQARSAGVLVVSPLRAALAERLGRKVAPSVLYRLLARHGWRKVSPDTKHPKSDLAAQAEWKKNSPHYWQICSPPKRSKDAPSV